MELEKEVTKEAEVGGMHFEDEGAVSQGMWVAPRKDAALPAL